jgi:hypothetical protein
MSSKGYNSVVAKRTSAADTILKTEDMLQGYIAGGGLARDLEGIRKAGQEAEAAHLWRSQSKSEGKSATVEVVVGFSAVRKEYSSVMGVVAAVTAELIRNGAPQDLVTKLSDILVNEAELSAEVTVDESGKKKRSTRKSATQEALRAEISKDMGALIALTEVHPALTERKVTVERLKALKEAADSLSTKLADRILVKGSGKGVTDVEHEAVGRQQDIWSSCYRILSALGAKDERVRALLKAAAKSK